MHGQNGRRLLAQKKFQKNSKKKKKATNKHETGEVYPCETRSESFGNVRAHGYDLRAVVRTARARDPGLHRPLRVPLHARVLLHHQHPVQPALLPGAREEWLRLRPALARRLTFPAEQSPPHPQPEQAPDAGQPRRAGR